MKDFIGLTERSRIARGGSALLSFGSSSQKVTRVIRLYATARTCGGRADPSNDLRTQEGLSLPCLKNEKGCLILAFSGRSRPYSHQCRLGALAPALVNRKIDKRRLQQGRAQSELRCPFQKITQNRIYLDGCSLL